MSLEIRNAVVADTEQIGSLLQTVQNLHAALYPNIFRHVNSSLIEQVAELLANPAFHIRLAVFEGEIVGYSVFRIDGCESSAMIHPHNYLFLEQIAVSPAFRRKGIATALLQDFRDSAAKMGITEIRLDVWGANADARMCFEKAGFSFYNYRMSATI